MRMAYAQWHYISLTLFIHFSFALQYDVPYYKKNNRLVFQQNSVLVVQKYSDFGCYNFVIGFVENINCPFDWSVVHIINANYGYIVAVDCVIWFNFGDLLFPSIVWSEFNNTEKPPTLMRLFRRYFFSYFGFFFFNFVQHLIVWNRSINEFNFGKNFVVVYASYRLEFIHHVLSESMATYAFFKEKKMINMTSWGYQWIHIFE